MYKLEKSADWSTLGINNSTDTSFDLREIYNITKIDIHELHYRVLVYFKNEELEGKEYSSTFSIIFKNKITAYLGTYDKTSISHYPAFDKINSNNIETLSVNINNNIKHLPLVDENSPLSSHLKVKTEKSIKSVASQYAKFTHPNIYGCGEFNKYLHQTYQYTDYAYRNDIYYYRYTYNYTGYKNNTYNYLYSSPYSDANYSVGNSPYSYSSSYNYSGYSSKTYYYYYTSSYARTMYSYNKTYLYYYRQRNSYKNGRYYYRYYYYYTFSTYYCRPPKINYTYISYTPAFAKSTNIATSSNNTISPKIEIISYTYGYFTGYVNNKVKYPAPSYSYYYYNSGAAYRYYRYSYSGYAYRYYRAYGYYYYVSSYFYAYKYLTAYRYYNYISSYSYFYRYAYGYKPYYYSVTNYSYKYLAAYRNNIYEIPVYGDNSYSYRYYTNNKQEVL